MTLPNAAVQAGAAAYASFKNHGLQRDLVLYHGAHVRLPWYADMGPRSPPANSEPSAASSASLDHRIRRLPLRYSAHFIRPEGFRSPTSTLARSGHETRIRRRTPSFQLARLGLQNSSADVHGLPHRRVAQVCAQSWPSGTRSTPATCWPHGSPPGLELDLYQEAGSAPATSPSSASSSTASASRASAFHPSSTRVSRRSEPPRFYVTRTTPDGTRKRGVVFISEFVPRAAITLVARSFYEEPYATLPMRHRHRAPPRPFAYVSRYRWRDRATRKSGTHSP